MPPCCSGPAIAGKTIPYVIRLHLSLDDLEIRTDGSTSTPMSPCLNRWCLLEFKWNKVSPQYREGHVTDCKLFTLEIPVLFRQYLLFHWADSRIYSGSEIQNMIYASLEVIGTNCKERHLSVFECLNLALWRKWYSRRQGNIQNTSLK